MDVARKAGADTDHIDRLVDLGILRPDVLRAMDRTNVPTVSLGSSAFAVVRLVPSHDSF